MFKYNNADTKIPEVSVWALLQYHTRLLIICILLVGINRAAGMVMPYLSKYLVDDVILQRSKVMIVELVGLVVLAIIVQAVSGFALTRSVSISALRLIADLRKRIHLHVTFLPVTFYDTTVTGALVSRVMQDVEGIRNLIGTGMIDFLGAVITSGIAFIILMRIDVGMTLAVFAVLAFFGFLGKAAIRKYRPITRQTSAIREEVVGRLAESLSGIRVVKAYCAELQEHSVFARGIDRLLKVTTINTKATAFLGLTVSILVGVIGALVMYFGSNGIIEGKMTLGDFFRYTMFMGVLIQPLLHLVSIGTTFNEAIVGLERVREVLTKTREDQDAGRSIKVSRLQGEICFESVSFSYRDNQQILDNVSMQAKPGTVTALVGPSGAGKSTIIGLIAAFYKPTKGAIWVDGVDLSQIDLHSYRAHLGIVPQDIFLFSGTVRENVAFSCPNATDEKILQACRLAHVDEFVNQFENAYETIVGERGVRCSMGQRQRIAIARAILANPRILILDEATSSLDSVSEAMIQDALSTLMRDRTTFVIAHRLSTIRQADQVLVVDGGRIVECGTHESLIEAKGMYWQLYMTQYKLESNLFLARGEIG